MAFIYNLLDTWNNAGTVFSGIKLNVTNTASAAGSKLIDLQIGGSTFFNVDKSGQVALLAGTAAAPTLIPTGDTNTGMWFPAADTIAFSKGGSEVARINSSAHFLVGGTTADAKLTVTGIGTTSTTPSTTTDIEATLAIRASNAGAGNGGMLMFGALQGYFGAIKGFLQNGAGPQGAIDFYTRNLATDTTLTQRMRINFDGRIGIGTGSPDALLSVNGIASFGAGAVATPSIAAFGDLNTGMWFPAADTIAWSTGGSERIRITSGGNLGVGTSSFGTSAATVLAIATGTAPTTGPADTIQIYSTDLSAGNTMLSLYTEGTVVNANTTAATTHRIAIRVNGTVYYLLANTAA